MHLLLILEIIAQIYFVVHAIKTEKARYWIYIIILVPWIGFLIYFFTEFLPDSQESQSAKVDRWSGAFARFPQPNPPGIPPTTRA